jgi:galactofuranosylgalactofuranosylrhamnosyl-N-acetylglucosaminyl-diphospho-decaprenol beta-1,5/1,6-galactofuranosyltransferase
VSLPGAAIWHVSWSDKNDAVDWQAYFHERNRLIAALLHSPFPRGGRIVRESLNTHTKHVVSMQYYAGEAVLRALEDVLAGPGQLHEWLPTRTAEIRTMKDDFSDAQISKRVADFPSPRRAKPPRRPDVKMPSNARVVPWAVKTVAKQLGFKPRELSRRHPEAIVPNQDARWWYLASLDSAVVSNAEGTGASFYQRDPEQMRRQLARSAKLHEELLANWPELSRTYKAALDGITSPEAWGETFRQNGVVDR